ncbi:hypothetical protein [Spirosoma fluviale]|uniref:Uncharacterized protein n=1 Tax=Spirosoma fluviale TaxID=1597977 RepID=A0A286FXX4_9BACT|nr:hypothetical protein [Spirosoma fluviale]SOD88115.1 hypothetical protein SAMN06269250_2505 [Spirosoma fluviale]
MKPTRSLFVTLSLCFLLQACKKPDCGCAPPFGSALVGKWQWVKTSTSSGDITPQTLGHDKSLSYGNDGSRNYLYLTEDGQPPKVLYQDNSVGESDQAQGLLVEQFSGSYIQFMLKKASDNTYQTMTTTDLVTTPSQGYGSTRHFYQRVGIPDKP